MTLQLISKFILSGALTFDLGSSIGQRELNPVLGRGDFGRRQVVIAVAATAGVLLLEHRLRGQRELEKPLVWTNLGFSAAHIGVGISNLTKEKKHE